MIERIFGLLLKEYGKQGWWPIVNPKTLLSEYRGDSPRNEDERFEIAVGAILTQNTSWKNVERALAGLKRASMLSKGKIKDMPTSDLAKIITSAGYYNQKAKKLKAFVGFRGELTRDNLLDIWGIGPETADSILLYAYAKPLFVVDAYTKRIFSRLGLAEEGVSYDSLQNLFHSSLDMDQKLFKEYHALIVEHAKRHCRTKPVCEGCPVNNQCRSFKKQKP